MINTNDQDANDADLMELEEETFVKPSLKNKKKHVLEGKLCQWATNGEVFIPTGKVIPTLPPGVYEIGKDLTAGLVFQKMQVKTENLIRFPDSNSDKVVEEIKTFWKRKDLFVKFGLPFKRGIILYGPAGSGKSSTVQLIMSDVIHNMKGIVIYFHSPSLFSQGMRLLRQIQQDTPVVVVMEDLDSIIDDCRESDVLNILDGIDLIENAVFLATTNYPERLGPRVINRPSRFDKRFKIGYPTAEARKVYLKHLFQHIPHTEQEIDKWVADTDEFSIAHLKELFIAVKILDDKYGDAVELLTSMKSEVSSAGDENSDFGFGKKRLAKGKRSTGW